MRLHLVTAYFVPTNREKDNRLMRVVVDLEKFVAAFPTIDGCVELIFSDRCSIIVRRSDYIILMSEIGLNGHGVMPEVYESWNNNV